MSDVLGYTYDSDEKYCCKGTSVLINKLDSKDEGELNVAMADAIMKRTAEMLEMDGLNGHYDLNHLRSFHKHLFQDVFDWAGEIRTVNISGGKFSDAESIKSDSEIVFLRLENEDYLKGQSVEDMADRLAYYSYEMDRIHPFRCGNFTAINAFLTQMCRRVGYTLDLSQISEDELEVARKESLEGNTSKMEAVFIKSLAKIPRKK